MEDKMIYKKLAEYYTSFNAINNLYSMWAKEKGLSYHTLFTLYAIYHSEGGCCQRIICEDWLIPKQTVSGVLKALEEAGYICCRALPQDRRNKLITFTDAGMEYAKPILEELYQLEKSVLEKMGEAMTQQMIEGNKIFYEKLREMVMEEK